ncbi:MAG TPA: NAD-dependent epimerase/dehydratase family protein, partial [Fimbriimonas sp.]|nr:NAD-dependent epimerase/dehydratase family protein [Fimbriimonas sp.]
GRAITEKLLAQGHQVTLFHRGKTVVPEFEGVPEILGDRNTDIAKADVCEWDAIVDVCAYAPSQARSAAKLRTKFYLFISTISVYSLEDPSEKISESSALFEPQEGEEVTGATYGPLKVACENVLSETFPTSLCTIRPGIVFGPHDPTGRFPYWVSRFDRYESVLVPASTEQNFQWVDVYDLADFCVLCVENGVTGTFNAVNEPTSIGVVFDEIRAQVGKEHNLVVASLLELEAAGIAPWTDLPLVLPDDSRAALFNVSNSLGVAAGLKCSPLSKTTSETLAWVRAGGSPEGKYGMSREREEALLK